MRNLGVVTAVLTGLRRQPLAFLRDVGRFPLVREAEQILATTPRVELVELLSARTFSVDLAPGSGRHGWSLGAAEQLIIQLLIEDRGVRDVFEIGTFNGGTTALMAEHIPPDGTVTTLDLPPEQFDATQAPASFGGNQVGEVHRASKAAGKVTQLYGDSLAFESAARHDSADLVLVDGAHDYEHGHADSITALRVVRPGGIVLWDDFEPYWHGLVKGIAAAMQNRHLFRIAGSAFGAHIAPI